MKRTDDKLRDALLSALVLLAAISLTWAGLRGSAPKDAAVNASLSAEAPEPTALPDDATVVVIDAGHGGFDGGATGAVTGAIEAELNLSVAEYLSNELTSKGYYVIMTRADSEALAETKKADMNRRSEIMRLEGVDVVVSIHMNKFGDPTVSGPMVFYMKNSAEGKALAESVMGSLCSELERPLRYANPEDLFVLREPTAPSVLVECGFLSNADDEAQLLDPAYRQRLAKAIAEGIDEYCSCALSQAG